MVKDRLVQIYSSTEATKTLARYYTDYIVVANNNLKRNYQRETTELW